MIATGAPATKVFLQTSCRVGSLMCSVLSRLFCGRFAGMAGSQNLPIAGDSDTVRTT
jgi:hypothetical protein